MRIYLRPLLESDALVSYKWRNDQDIWAYTGSKPNKVITAEIETKWIKSVLNRKNEKRFAICVEETNEYIGNVQLTNINDYDAEFHIFIGEKKYWRGGYGTEATKKLVEYAFDKLMLSCIYLSVKESNEGAIKAYYRAGFYKILNLNEGFIKMVTYAIDKKPKKLSVFMITYNHEEYISQALDSILMQQVDFEYEIVVGEDCSRDNTRKILKDYHKRYPNKFKLLLPSENIGANKNQIQTLMACRGEYIAMLEGDDFWTDSLKLQKQINFLENNKQYVACCHNVKFDTDTVKPLLNDGLIKTEDFFKFNPVVTLSVVFRNNFNGNFPDWLSKCGIGDWPLHLYNLQFGNYYYFSKEMGYYRRNPNGFYSKMHHIAFSEKVLLSLEVTRMNLGNFINGRLDTTILNYKLNIAKVQLNFINFYTYAFNLNNRKLSLKKILSPIKIYFNV